MKKVIFVLGMGRSGTSALTRVLSLCGAALPESLLGAHESNPAGHWEPLDALRLNDAFLARHGSDWWDPTLRLQEHGLTEPDREAFITEIAGFLEACPPAPLLVIKDPRVSAIAEYWFEAARRTGYEPVVAIAIRHPGEVAASLTARDRATPQLGYVLWLKYNLLAEVASRGLPRVFVSYASLLVDWRRERARVERALQLESGTCDEAAIDDFLQTDLYRQRASEIIDGTVVSPLVVRLYGDLWRAAHDGPLDVAAVDGVFSEYRRYERLFRIAFDDHRTRFGTVSPAAQPALSDSLDDATRAQIKNAEKQPADTYIFVDDVAVDGKAVVGTVALGAAQLLTIRGWALDHRAGDVGAAVFAVVEDRFFRAAYGFARSDVAAAFGNVRFLQSGFRFDIPLTSLPPGVSTLRVAMLGATRTMVYECSTPIEIDADRIEAENVSFAPPLEKSDAETTNDPA